MDREANRPLLRFAFVMLAFNLALDAARLLGAPVWRGWPPGDAHDIGALAAMIAWILTTPSGNLTERLQVLRLIDQLRADEGNAITILCDNPEGPPNNAVEVVADWTGWEERRFDGATLLEALQAAAAAAPSR
jgi:hypothetical protein